MFSRCKVASRTNHFMGEKVKGKHTSERRGLNPESGSETEDQTISITCPLNGSAMGGEYGHQRVLKNGGPWTTKWRLLQRYSEAFRKRKTPREWNRERVIMIYKQGDKSDLKNYIGIAISSLDLVEKVFARVLANNLSSEAEEKGAFRKQIAVQDHLLTL